MLEISDIAGCLWLNEFHCENVGTRGSDGLGSLNAGGSEGSESEPRPACGARGPSESELLALERRERGD